MKAQQILLRISISAAKWFESIHQRCVVALSLLHFEDAFYRLVVCHGKTNTIFHCVLQLNGGWSTLQQGLVLHPGK